MSLTACHLLWLVHVGIEVAWHLNVTLVFTFTWMVPCCSRQRSLFPMLPNSKAAALSQIVSDFQSHQIHRNGSGSQHQEQLRYGSEGGGDGLPDEKGLHSSSVGIACRLHPFPHLLSRTSKTHFTSSSLPRIYFYIYAITDCCLFI